MFHHRRKELVSVASDPFVWLHLRDSACDRAASNNFHLHIRRMHARLHVGAS